MADDASSGCFLELWPRDVRTDYTAGSFVLKHFLHSQQNILFANNQSINEVCRKVFLLCTMEPKCVFLSAGGTELDGLRRAGCE